MSDDFLDVPTEEEFSKAYADHAVAHPGICDVAIQIIQEMSVENCTCQIRPVCSTRTRRKKARRRTHMSCAFCSIYVIAHGAHGCIAEDCPVCAKGVSQIEEFSQNKEYIEKGRRKA